MGLLLSKCCCINTKEDIQYFRPIADSPLLFPTGPFGRLREETVRNREREWTTIGVWDPYPINLPPPLMSYTPLSEREQCEEDLYWYERNVIVASKMAQKMDKEMD